MTRRVAVTFDNLREEAGVRALPRVLALLEQVGVRATFFVEGVNAELHPAALRGIADAGHEVACHAWAHEDWGTLEPAEEERALAHATEALTALGLRPRGFRPPGGRLNPGSPKLLREHGYAYASPADGGAARIASAGAGRLATADGIALLPFRWPEVDAYHQLPLLRLTVGGQAPRRLRRSALARRVERLVTARRSAPGVARGRDAMLAALRDASQDVVLIFHPFLLDDDAARAAASDVLAEAARLGARPCEELV